MAKSKYTPEAVAKVEEALKETGRDADAWAAAQVSHDTFYTWIKRHPEFAEKVALWKKWYQDHLPKKVRQDATAKLVGYLKNGITEQWHKREVIKDGAGNVITTREITSKVIRDTPHWVFDRIFGKQAPIVDALNLMVSEGVALPEQLEIVNTALESMKTELKALEPAKSKGRDREEKQGDR